MPKLYSMRAVPAVDTNTMQITFTTKQQEFPWGKILWLRYTLLLR